MIAAKSNSRQARKQQRVAQKRTERLQTILIIGAIAALVGGVILLSLSAPNAVIHPAKIGQPISDFTLTDINGVTHKISDYAGKPVLINGWATWCPPCRGEMPALYDFYLKHKDAGFELLAINAGESRETAANFIHSAGFTFPVLIDPNQHVLDSLGVDGFPTSIFVGRDGVVKYIHVGGLTPDNIEQEIAPLLSQ